MQTSNFDVIDVSKQCPTYFAALQKKKNDVSAKELLALQYELESMLISHNKRRKILATEITVQQEKKAEKPKAAEIVEKRKSISGDKPSKKFKASSGKAHSSTASNTKGKNLLISKPVDYEFSEALVDVPKVQKNDAPSRFWSMMDPYCAELTQDDVKTLEDWILSHDNDFAYQNIPPFGEHFADEWIKEDIFEEMKEGSKSVECPKGFINDETSNSEERENLIKNAKIDRLDSQEFTIGTLTERLVSALVEENLMTALDDEMTDACTGDSVAVRPNFFKPCISNDGENLEMRLFKDLFNNGFLEDNKDLDAPDDELQCELKKLQAAIKPVSEYNKLQKKKLLALTKSEINKQEVRMKLQECDARVMEFYRAMAAARLKKKKLNKKEQEQVLSMLEKRKNLVAELERL